MDPEPILFLISIPAMILSFIISILGVINVRHWFVVTGAAFFIPMTFLLNSDPNLNGIAFILPLLMLGSAIAIRAKRRFWAWILLLPSFLAGLWFASILFELFYLIARGGL